MLYKFHNGKTKSGKDALEFLREKVDNTEGQYFDFAYYDNGEYSGRPIDFHKNWFLTMDDLRNEKRIKKLMLDSEWYTIRTDEDEYIEWN